MVKLPVSMGPRPDADSPIEVLKEFLLLPPMPTPAPAEVPYKTRLDKIRHKKKAVRDPP